MVELIFENEGLPCCSVTTTVSLVLKTLFCCLTVIQVMSEMVASALQFVDEERTSETWQFIRMIDLFFDALNVKNPLEGKLKRKTFHHPYCNSQNERFKVYMYFR